MGSKDDDEAKKAQIVETRARKISHNVICTKCGSQSLLKILKRYCYSPQESSTKK